MLSAIQTALLKSWLLSSGVSLNQPSQNLSSILEATTLSSPRATPWLTGVSLWPLLHKEVATVPTEMLTIARLQAGLMVCAAMLSGRLITQATTSLQQTISIASSLKQLATYLITPKLTRTYLVSASLLSSTLISRLPTTLLGTVT